MRQHIPDGPFDKVINLKPEETAKYVISQTRITRQGKDSIKKKQEVYDHKLCVLTDEVINTELSIPLFMILPDEGKEQ
ncbi:hypothetical protein C922_05418 [Plasmodium inui San Antonio 1]|uniref:Uncharacterized protein n=1 Tax=Plasmodium inui San Antonio 1 TaxID=1237626 RepID=W6ZTG6_9APIC|nr:hypothetical protein C922_05418 [Plasmodium inui San Antonio 1]EUD64207.1 hypothetical protein C922_05418 [Plasmodium inui San Antonio 1]